MINKQLHISVDPEAEKMIRQSADYYKISISAFVVATCIDKARRILRETEELYETRNT